MILQAHYECPLGSLTIGYEHNAVVSLRINASNRLPHSPSPVTDLAAGQLREYFDGTRQEFTFPIRPAGTDYQQAVWAELRRIPYGQTRTYGQIAAALGNPKAARAVGRAANRNPIWITIPCHRVVGKDSSLVGYAGGLELKEALLKLEQNNSPE